MSEVTKQDLQDAVVELKTYIEQRSEKVETNFLSAFHAWVRSMERDKSSRLNNPMLRRRRRGLKCLKIHDFNFRR